MTYLATPEHKNPSPRGHEIYNFGTPFLGHDNYTLSLSVLCLEVERKIFKEIMHFHNMKYGHAPAQEPCSRGHAI